jgi:hypothetical protein
MMRFTAINKGLSPGSPTVYIEGVAPISGVEDATTDPLIELYETDDDFPRLGIGYKGTVADGATLRLSPAFASWLGTNTGVSRALSLSSDGQGANPAAPGPWQPEAGGPAGDIAAFCQTGDKYLYAATSAGVLWRTDGRTWTQVIDLAPEIRCLASEKTDLLIGTSTGLLAMVLHPEPGDPFTTRAIADFNTLSVYRIFRDASGGWWVGAGVGLFKLQVDAAGEGPNTYIGEAFGLSEANSTATAVYDIAEDDTGNLFVGTELGVFQYQVGTGHWYWYQGKETSDSLRDWQRCDPLAAGETERNFPESAAVYIPPVYAVRRGPDESIWMGTTHGIARYVARSVRGLTFETVLEAFPDVTSGPVRQIVEDERGGLWFCTDRGLFRFDGRDWWQATSEGVHPIGRADTVYTEPEGPRGSYRFLRDSTEWERLDADDSSAPVISSDETPVHAMAFTDVVNAALGTFDGTAFTTSETVDDADLVIRYKPTEQRIVTGGIPAIPRQPLGASVWRYLSMEPEGLTTPDRLPAWTIEGRQWLPPEQAAPYPGRFNDADPSDHPESLFDEVIFAFLPSARVWFQRGERQLLSAVVRLDKRSDDETIDPAILDRVRQGIEQVRPAGVKVRLAVGATEIGE